MELSELFAQSAREVLPLARSKGLVSYFDYRGPLIRLTQGDAALRGAVHRVMLGLTDCIASGFVLFSAEVSAPHDGFSQVVIRAAGTGSFVEADVQDVLRRLQLNALPPRAGASGQAAFSAQGVCPGTGGQVTFVDGGADGTVISLEMVLGAVEIPASEPLPDAAGVTAWLVSPIPGGLDSVSRRLRRQGWLVRAFNSLAQASDRMIPERAEASVIPKLFIVAESSGAELPELERIAAAEPGMWTVLAVVEGSPAVQARGRTAVDIRILPLSPMELERFTAHVDRRTSTDESRRVSPAPRYVQDRRRVLVVEDNAVNQLLADGLLDILGYEVSVVDNGLEALNACRGDPPDMVLMDLDMPVMGGLDATVRLRSLQQVGTLPPFPIVAASADLDANRELSCRRAGMDGCLVKPLDIHLLADELHRVLPTRPVGDDAG